MKPAVRNLILVLMAAVVLTFVLRVLLVSNQPHQAAPPVHLLAAATDLPAGLLLRASDETWQTVSADAVPKNAIVQGSPDAKALQGSLLHNPITKDALILSSDVISPSTPGFLAAALKPGLRAISVSITDVTGNAGLIQPGDMVDLLLIQTLHDKPAAHSVVGETIATGLRVIAVGSSFQRPKDSDQSNANTQARTVTLEVTPRAAEVVSVAARLGDLALSLRSFATTNPADTLQQQARVIGDINASGPANAPIWAGDISQAIRNPQKVSISGVVILRGSAAQSQINLTTQPLANSNNPGPLQ